MDSTGSIQFFLILLTIIAVVGFAGIMYYLAGIARSIKRLGGPAVPETPPGPKPTAPASLPPLKAIKPGEMANLEETLGAISKKYSLISLTLAAADGLLIGSTKPGSENEAARYSHLYSRGKRHGEGGVELLGISYRGETVVGIARPSEHLSSELMNALEQDIRETLQHWV
ncbi:MAG: hypothetical protein GX837_02925 [Methanomicrobiales archaeon]|jgi:hypothetical protein|nr:hypothetical protein [Methanomicrobiales archaeon]